MRIIPAIDMMNHQVVQLVGGVPGSEKIKLPDPVKVAGDWLAKGAKSLHLVDLDAAFGNEGNIPSIKAIAREYNVPMEVGGGIKKEETIVELLDAGVTNVILGTKAITDRAWLREMAMKYPDTIVLALDTKDGNITTKAWQGTAPISLNDMLAEIADLPLAGILNTNVNVEGQGKGIDEQWVASFMKKTAHKVIASGGVSSLNDAQKLAEYGVSGAVVGVSIYTGLMAPWEWPTPWEA